MIMKVKKSEARTQGGCRASKKKKKPDVRYGSLQVCSLAREGKHAIHLW
jgi:hypothetical protein